MIDIFARAAHAPQSSVRVPAGAVETVEPILRLAVSATPLGDAVADRILADFGIPRSVLVYVNYPTHFDSRQTEMALSGTDITVPPLEAYAGKLWDYWERHLDPDLFRDRTLMGAARGRLGLIGGIAQVIEQQIPDELMRLGRRLQGSISLEKAVRGRVVMVTGASSGIGKSAALKIAAAGGTVLLVARTPEKLEQTKEQIEAEGGVAYIHRADLSDPEDIDDRMADEALAQHGHVDILINNAGRSIRRSIALSYDRPHDFERTIQLNYLGAVRLILKLAACDARPQVGPDHQHQLDRRADEHASLLGLRCLEVGARCVLPLDRLGNHRRRRSDHHDPHAAGSDADDRPDEDVRPLPDDHAGGGRRHDLRGDHHKPKRIATRSAHSASFLYAINPKSIDYILNSAYHLFPDSSAAKGEKRERKPESGRPPAASGERASDKQVLFANLMRGVHW